MVTVVTVVTTVTMVTMVTMVTTVTTVTMVTIYNILRHQAQRSGSIVHGSMEKLFRAERSGAVPRYDFQSDAPPPQYRHSGPCHRPPPPQTPEIALLVSESQIGFSRYITPNTAVSQYCYLFLNIANFLPFPRPAVLGVSKAAETLRSSIMTFNN